MRDLIKESINNLDAALELRKIVLNKIRNRKLKESDIIEILDAIDDLSLEEIIKLGSNFRKFPLGCDLVDIAIGPCASNLSMLELLENCILADYIGYPIHICAYAIADIAEKEGIETIELFKKIIENVEVPIDIDHFGQYGPMRFPKEITHCYGECYFKGYFRGCPRKRIHKRLIEKEKKERFVEDYIRLASTVCVNVVEEQGAEEHAAPIEEMEIVANLAKKYGKGLEGIFHVGDGYDDLIEGINACLKLDVDVFVIEGACFNRAKDKLKAFAKAVAISRILVKGGVVATNGAYENECRIALRAGLNTIITGFPYNHHGYMCGYSPGTAKRGNFGLRRVMRIIKEEIKDLNVKLADKNINKAIAMGNNFLKDKIYPYTLGSFFLGDAHWRAVKESKLMKYKPEKTIDDIKEDKLGLIGGRYIAWAIAEKAEEVYISDRDPWVEKATVKVLNENGINAYPCNGDDREALRYKGYITTFIPELALKIYKKLKEYNNIELLI
ncbi:fibrillarin-like protein [Methanocaldococcus villosus KIN24-T80]|uniref:Fibrillarin-like protein n=1 Tax=Methanocaldococcus villosus KIN24-T80 TaxID=1069083 RepID=N6UUG8_9EURY|nr:5,10-methenyltetrahydromethanopterin hydrogenase cofactor biosynthesis protein HmdC [Methanocaldococcus villosus]ENN95984.1 fibrillarin-like protein [Methanocaldococcus villosus KIN24-T80]